MEQTTQSLNVPVVRTHDPLEPLDSGRHGILMSTFDTTDRAQKVKQMRIVQDDRLVTKEIVGNVIEVEHIICTVAELPDDDTGELVYRQRVFLVPPNGGQVVASTAKGVMDSLRLAFDNFGKPPWNPALKFEVKRYLTSARREVIKLLPVE